MLKRLTAAGGLTIATVVGMSTPATADDIWGSVDCNKSPNPGCDLVAGKRGQGGISGQHNTTGTGESGYDGIGCRHVPINYRDPAGKQPDGPGGWFVVLCSPDGKDPDSHGPVWIPTGAAEPSLSPAQVAEIARRRLQLPDVRIAASPVREHLVNLPTWLWLTDGWREVSASASVPGVSVTAVAKPSAVTWSMGDGNVVTCTGSGTPYTANADPKAPSPDCGHTYRQSSAAQRGEAYLVSATVHWTISWSGAGQSGVFPHITSNGSAAFRVVESQGLNAR